MLVDHVAWAFVLTGSLLGQLMHFVGRMTGPVMAFFLAEGYLHTRSVKRYALRLGVFALLSWPACSLFEFGYWPSLFFGAIFTLFLGLLAIWIWDKSGWHTWIKILVVSILCLLSLYGDWPLFDVLWPLCFFLFHEDKKRKWGSYYMIGLWSGIVPLLVSGTRQLFQIGVLFVPFLLEYCYNGEGGGKKPFHKWFFFAFYPLHLLILWYLKKAI